MSNTITQTLQSKSWEEVFKFLGFFKIKILVEDVYATITAHEEGEYHYVEVGHWANGTVYDTIQDPDTIEVVEAFFYVPLISSFFGEHIGDTINEKLNEKFGNRFCAFIKNFLEHNFDGFDWEE